MLAGGRCLGVETYKGLDAKCLAGGSVFLITFKPLLLTVFSICCPICCPATICLTISKKEGALDVDRGEAVVVFLVRIGGRSGILVFFVFFDFFLDLLGPD